MAKLEVSTPSDAAQPVSTTPKPRKRRAAKTIPVPDNVVRMQLVQQPVAPSPDCSDVANMLKRRADDARCGLYQGALFVVVDQKGKLHWSTAGTLRSSDGSAREAAAWLTRCVFEHRNGTT